MRRLISASTLIVALALAACGTEPARSPGASIENMPSEGASTEPTASVTATDEPQESQEPAPSAEGGIPVDTVVGTTVEGLAVRVAPGTDADRIGFLTFGTVAYVLEGPTQADGLPWYRITGLGLPYASGCATTPPDQPISCPAFHGWAAGASAEGDPWLAPTDPGECPEATIVTISETGFTWRLICWSDEPITFDAWWPELPDDAGLGGACGSQLPGGFLYCQHINHNGINASPEEGEAGVVRMLLSIDPASGVTMPERGQWIRVTGQFDHPAAADCANPDLLAEDEDPDIAVLSCRLQFVPTSVEVIPG